LTQIAHGLLKDTVEIPTPDRQYDAAFTIKEGGKKYLVLFRKYFHIATLQIMK